MDSLVFFCYSGRRMTEDKINSLFHIYNSEQNTLLRLDQKAYTLISFMGVLMAFFIVHYKGIPHNTVMNAVIFLYFASSLIALSSLLMVIVPRIKQKNTEPNNRVLENPLFFAGIISYKNSLSYSQHIEALIDDPKEFRKVVADSIYGMAAINNRKKKFFHIGIFFFTATLYFEVLIILLKFLGVFE